MSGSIARELVLPALRLDVPSRPTREHLAVLAERSAEQWTTGAADWTAAQVVRLAVAALLEARLAQAAGEQLGRTPLPADPAEVTVSRLAGAFRPHVDLVQQAFQVGVVDAVNSGVPAVADPLREGLRRVGVTGRDPIRAMLLGLDRVPPRAKQEFWKAARGSVGVTATLDALTAGAGSHDVTTLDRSHLARADALVQAGGRTTAILATPGAPRARDDGGSWLSVPLTVTRGHGPHGQHGAPRGTEVALSGGGWREVFDAALAGVGAAMQRIDLGGTPRGRSAGLAEAVADRLAAAKDRTVADVCASLRAVDPTVLELYGDQVGTSTVPVAVPVVDDDQFVQLWLPTSALAGPLVTGAADLFLGGRSEVRSPGRRPGGKPTRPPQKGGGTRGQSGQSRRR